MRRCRPATTAVVVMAMALAACSSKDTIDSPRATGEARRGGDLVVGISVPSSIEPSNAADPSGALVVSTMCDPLVQIDPVTGALKSAVAESWIISDGGRRFTVKLRKGVRFHNGSEVTADDAVFSLSRVAGDDAASPLAPLLRLIDGYEQVRGEEGADGRNRKTLKGLRAISKFGFEITLTESNADFIRVLAHPLASLVPKEAVERDPVAFAAQPLCAGPYRLAAPWTPGGGATSIRLQRFDRYKPVNEGYTAAGAGYADNIEFRISPDAAGEVSSYLGGALDVAHVPRSRAAEAAPAGADLIRSPGTSLEYIGLPTRTPPFDNPRVRIALSQALDRGQLVAGALGGAADPAQGYLPRTLGGVHRTSACRGAPTSADVPAARAALAALGVDLAGTTVPLYFNDEFGHRAVVEEVARQWEAALGLKVAPASMAWEEYATRATSTGGFDAPFRLNWSSPVSSADAYLSPLFESRSIGGNNLSRFSDPNFDRLLQRVARHSEDEKDRRLDYQRLEDMICEQMPVVPVDFAVRLHLVRQSKFASARGPLTDLATGNVLLRELYPK